LTKSFLSFAASISMRGGASSSLEAESSSVGDIAVVGCGVLGTSVCRQLMHQPSSYQFTSITGITKTTARHDDIRAHVLSGKQQQDDERKFHVSTVEQVLSQQTKYKNVIFCAPPSGSEDYAKDIEQAITTLWQGPTSGGTFVFTSSGAVYGSGAHVNVVTEASPTDHEDLRAKRLIDAEEACLSRSGTVLRLAGLYILERGPHSYWLRSGKDTQGRADGLVNLLHYDDAAGACIAALAVGPALVHGKVFLISDGHPLTRQEICASALKHPMYSGNAMPKFVGSDSDPVGKIYDGSWSNQQLKWKPGYSSFVEFMTTTESS